MTQLIYVADPMCSWCYGFGPELSRLLSELGDAELGLVMGGLRSGTTEPMDAQRKATLHEHWQQVHEASGLPFSDAAMADPGFVYDTEPACRAVVAVRELLPARSLDYFHAVQEAFYADAKDVTRSDVLADIAETMAIPRAEFIATFESALTREATQQDFLITQRWGVSGFPTLIMEHRERLHALTVGYTKTDDLSARMRSIIET